MNTNVLKGIFINSLLLLLAILSPHSAIAKPETGSSRLGILAYIQDGGLQGGDLWVKALPNGQAKRLTTDGYNREPRWSPSGQWLAFRKEGQVWIVNADGNDARPLNAGAAVEAFAWAPTQDRLAYITGTGELQTINADGTGLTMLVSQLLLDRGLGRVDRLAWSPDGAWLAYEWWTQQPDRPPTYQGLWKVTADGGKQIELYASGIERGKGEAILAGWSSDGRFLLFWQSEIRSPSILADGVPLYALPAGGGIPMRLAEPVLAYPDFIVPDSTASAQMAIVVGGGRFTQMNKILHIVSASTGEDVSLTPPDVVVSSPVWSPDGTRIAYAAMPDQGQLGGRKDDPYGLGQRRIWVVNVGGEPQSRQLTDDPAYGDERPLWSADGSYLLFTRLDARGRVSLWLIPPEGNAPQQVVDELFRLPPGWFGYYGHIRWDKYFDWWRGTTPTALPVTGGISPAYPLLFTGGILVLLTGLGLLRWQR